MSDDPNQPQNPTPTENFIPTSSQEPTEPASENTAHSEPVQVLPGPLESSPNGFSDESNNIPLSNSTPLNSSDDDRYPKFKTQIQPRLAVY